MVEVLQARGRTLEDPLLKAMFEARKRVFVDLLKWDVPVYYDRYEMDRFDDDRALYLIVAGPGREHLASARLLETEGPHLLGDIFAPLCAGEVPRGADVREITRFCLSRELAAPARLRARNALIAGLVEHALASGIARYTGVAEMGWLQQILSFGWRCRPLGLPATVGGRLLGAIEIVISAETPALLERSGILARPEPAAPHARAA